eukprot:gene35867-44229_t
MQQTAPWNSANSRTLIRCIDVILQTVHFLLNPNAGSLDNDYTELMRAVDIENEDFDEDLLPPPLNMFKTGGRPISGRTLSSPSTPRYHVDAGDSDVYTTALRDKAYRLMSNESDTFKLTQTALHPETNAGAPRGVLTPSSPDRKRSSFAANTTPNTLSTYNNRSLNSPRLGSDVKDVDRLLEERQRSQQVGD